MALQPKIARLKSQLAVTGLQKKDNALFQVIDGLIRAVEQSQAATSEEIAAGGGGGGVSLANEDYLTYSNEAGTLPNSRELLAGLGVQFDDTIANERTVDVVGEREVENVVTGSIASGASESGFWAIGATTWQVIQLIEVESDRAGYLVLYASAADRDADTRALPAIVDPVAGEGIFLDAAFDSDVVSIDVSPPVVLYNNEAPVVQKIYYRFFNQEATAGVTTFTLTFVVSNGGGGTGGGSVAVAHNMLSATHSDSTPASGVDGDLIIHDTTWKRLAKSTNGRALILTAGLPAWSLDGSALSLNASNLAAGTIPDARFPAILPVANGSNLTTLNASNLASGTIPSARFATVPTARVNLTSNQSINNATWTFISWEAAVWNIGGLWVLATNPSRFTALAAGKYLVIACITFEANATGVRFVQIVKNGSIYVGGFAGPSISYAVVYNVSQIMELAINDYVEIVVYQEAGIALNVLTDNATWFEIYRLGD